MSTVELVQQVIVPAYVWQDDEQRRGVVVKAAQTLLERADRDKLALTAAIEEALITPSFLKAEVGEADGVRFVAYGPCEPGMADLVFVVLSIGAVER